MDSDVESVSISWYHHFILSNNGEYNEPMKSFQLPPPQGVFISSWSFSECQNRAFRVIAGEANMPYLQTIEQGVFPTRVGVFALGYVVNILNIKT